MMIRIDPHGASDESLTTRLAPAMAALAAERLVIVPTDTLYGLAADPRSAMALDQLRTAKGRFEDQGFPLIAADRGQVERDLGRLSPLAARLADRFWPGPLSIVMEARRSLVDACGERGRVAVRVPSHPVSTLLARGAGHPITATSANWTGQPPAAAIDELAPELLAGVAVIIDAGRLPGGAPSTIVDVTGRVPKLLRAGAVPWERVLESLG